MVAENYACAYREVIEILKYTNQDDVNKIPSEKLLLWLDNMKEDYNFEIDEEKPLSEQYNPNDIFKNKNQINIETDNISDNVAMVEYKVSLSTKIFNKIKCIFKK